MKEEKNLNNVNNLKNYISIILFSLFVIGFSILCAGESKADNQKISELQSERKENQENQSSLSEQASDMAESQASLETLVSQFNAELESINTELNDLNTKVDEKSSEIDVTEVELESAEAEEEEQYEDMKLRIQFMYEMKQTNIFDIFFSGESLADSLNKMEYVDNVVTYDRKKVDEYKQIKEKIEDDKELLESQKAELESLQADKQAKSEEMEKKIEDTNAQIKEYAQNIQDAEAKALEYEKKIEEQNAAIYEEYRRMEEESIRAAMQAESESIEKAKADGTYVETETYTTDYKASTSDVDKLAALIECEAANQPYLGKLAVGAVVVNRIASPKFGNTLTQVVYQPYQFTPVLSGRFEIVLARGANEECYRAAREVLIDGHIVGNWIYFRTINGHPGDIIGDHVFYSIY